MGYKKITIIAVVFLLTYVMSFSSTHCQPRTLPEIRHDACPDGRVRMKKIVKDTSKFSWKKPNETILLFPAEPGFSEEQLQVLTANTTDSNALNYAKESLRLIPPVARTKKFLRLYVAAILTVKNNHRVAKANESMVVEAFKAFEGCCIPLDMGKTEVPDTYQKLSSLINDPRKNEQPPNDDLLQPVE